MRMTFPSEVNLCCCRFRRRTESECFQERDEVLLFLWGKVETEVVTFYSVGFGAVGFEPCGDVVIVEALGIEPVLQRRAPSAVAAHASVPDAFEGGDFVVAGSAASVHREGWVGSH